MVMMIVVTGVSEALLLCYRNFYFGLWLEGVLLFYLFFAVPGPTSLKKLLYFIELHPSA